MICHGWVHGLHIVAPNIEFLVVPIALDVRAVQVGNDVGQRPTSDRITTSHVPEEELPDEVSETRVMLEDFTLGPRQEQL